MVMVVGSMILVMVIGAAESQVKFPISKPKTPKPIIPCTATNGHEGTCFEFRTDGFRSCSFFPSLDTSNPDVSKHLIDNTCNNTGTDRQLHFCCPSDAAPVEIIPTPPPAPDQRPDFIPREEECGQSIAFNVVGGDVTQPGDWPWLAAIGTKVGIPFNQFCGGTLVTKQHVITAAHCFVPRRFDNTIVRLGEYDTSVENDGALDFDIVDERIANYDQVTNENDIMILKLDRPLDTFTDSIRPACLPYHLRNQNLEGMILTVVGWGIFDIETKRSSQVPLSAHVPVVPVPECHEKYINTISTQIFDNQLCAGTGGADSCGGDSGGPINHLDLEKGRFYLVGAVSFGPRECGTDTLPGVYARITSYLDWIDENIGQML